MQFPRSHGAQRYSLYSDIKQRKAANPFKLELENMKNFLHIKMVSD